MAHCDYTGTVLLVLLEMLSLCAVQCNQMRNVAIYKECGISSRHSENEGLYISGNCSSAINGNTNTTFDITKQPPNCIHTSLEDNRPFWWVDLGQEFTVHKITIYGRRGQEQRMTGVKVWLDSSLVKTFPGATEDITVTTDLSLQANQRGRVVNITRNLVSPSDKVPLLNICEVQVWVCDTVWWGNNCQNPCSAYCLGRGEENSCDPEDGSCLKGCSDGHYNKTNGCQNTCGEGCHDTCSRTDGTCQCRPGWQPPLCQQCSDGHYNVSNDCQNTCGEGCNNTCNRTDGTCQCQTGWQPPLCQDCYAGRYGKKCTSECGRCRDNKACDPVYGTCPDGCSEGFETQLCQTAHKGEVSLIWPLVGGVGGGALVFIFGIILGMRLKRCRSQQHPALPHDDILTARERGKPPSKTFNEYENTSFSKDIYETVEQPGDCNQGSLYTSLDLPDDVYENMTVR
ncbi:cell death abnormality protein 1-like isoform X2 [Pomacea canaliculata]|uniref:cell death abnormality protein 1-like isoform X2 n=1 Tax=Pomacea canaliculata TaxID=400727 RepID=UPI000D73B861|nr:cell death abnormality protein 1-like isoform X2 [Pomacea canaliculata]